MVSREFRSHHRAGVLIGSRVAEAAGKAGYSVTRILRKPPLSETPGVLQHDLRLPSMTYRLSNRFFTLPAATRVLGGKLWSVPTF